MRKIGKIKFSENQTENQGRGRGRGWGFRPPTFYANDIFLFQYEVRKKK